MRILVGAWFSLPRLGRDAFALLMRHGVIYDRDMGFKFDSGTDLQAAVSTLGAATGEEVELTLRCFLCGRESCIGCPYFPSCDRSAYSTFCLCSEHSPDKSVFDLYSKTFSMQMAD